MVESPHLYRRGAPAGLPSDVVDAALRRIREQKALGLKPILSLRHLGRLSDVSYNYLRRIVARIDDPYEEFVVPKRNGAGRNIAAPEPILMEVQRWILAHVLDLAPTHSASFAFTKERSCAMAAREHLGAAWIIKIDFENFYDSISEKSAYQTFHNLGYQPLVAFEMARLCTRVNKHSASSPSGRKYAGMKYQPMRLGTLPQGAPTSGALANQHCLGLDRTLSQWAIERGYAYSRYADDIAISGSGSIADHAAREVIDQVRRVGAAIGLTLNRKKTRTYRSGDRRAVLGILVDGDTLRLRPSTRRRIDDHLRAIEKFSLTGHASHAGFRDDLGLLNHVRGLIDYAHDVDPEWAFDRYRRLDQALGRNSDPKGP